MRRIAIALCVSWAVLASHVARAQDVGQPEEVDRRLNAEVWGELGFWTSHYSGFDGTALTMEVGGGYRVTRELLLRAEWPLYYASGSVNLGLLGTIQQSAFDTGNPFLSAYYVYESSDLRLLAGGGVNIPIAPSRNLIDTVGAGWSAGVHGNVDQWLWIPDLFAIVGRGQIEPARPIGGVLILRGDLALGPMIPVGNARGNTQFDIQLGVTVGAQLTRELSTGLRFWAVWVPTDDTSGDNAQTSLTPYLRGDFGRGFFDVSLTMNLDSPLGFAFDQGKVWGLRLAGGGRF